MNKLLSMSIKSQLFVMVFIMAFFAAGIIVYSGISFRNEKISEALKASAMLADSVANEHEKMVADIRQLMLTLAQLSDIRGLNPAGMQPVLKKVLSVNPKYSNIFIADRAGRVLASAVPAKDTNISDRRYFTTALATGRFSSGEYTISRFTGKTVLPFCYPLRDKGGEIPGVIVMGIDLTYYRTLLNTLQLPSGSSYLLLDHKGTIMTRGINPADFVGEQYNPVAFKRMAEGPDKDTFAGVAHDGTKRFISYRKVRLEGEPTPYMYIRAGIPVAAALSVANKALILNLALLTSSLCFIVVFVLLIAKHSIIDRIALLERASRRLADGDLHVKVSDFVAGGELGRLGLNFDHMASQIALRAEALRESEQRYHTIFEQSPDGILLIDTEGKMIEFNEIANRQLGYSHEEFEKLGLSDIDPFESPEEIRDKIGEILKKGRAEFVARHMTKQGEIRDVNIITKVIVLSGRPVMYAIWHDITARKQAEEALKNSEERLNTILDNVGAAIFIKDTKYRYTYVNRKTCEVFGRSAEEILGKSDKEFFSSESVEEIMRSDRPVIERGETATREETELKSSDKVPRTYWTVKLPLRDGMGTVTGLCGISTDITELKQAEKALQESEKLLRESQIIAGLGSYILDIPTGLWRSSDLLDNLFGIGEAYERSVEGWIALIHPDDRTMMADYFRNEVLGQGKTFDKEYRIIRYYDQSERWVHGSGKLEFDVHGCPLKMLGTIQDITGRKKMEEQLRQTQKLESIGTLAGGIAHDFNNLLQGVFGYISLAKMTYDQKEKSLSMLEQAEAALHMAVNLTTQLLTFSKGGKPVKKLIRLRPAVENAVKLALSGSNTNYEMDIPAELWSVEADEGQLAQVIQNIVLNANEAMAGSGTVRLSLGNVDITKDSIVSLPEGGQFVRIAIQDSGTGINEQNLSRIFDPYFTTKQKGSGLGLATSYSIIKNHGGVIEVKSEVNRGTIFTIYLPASNGEEIKTATTTSNAVGTKKSRILIMDDEELVRNVAQEMLVSLGHDVVSAEDGKKAIDLFLKARETGNPFDLLILDLTVKGGMGGEEALRKIRDIDPGVKAVVSSGYADGPVVADYHAYGFVGFLKKPYKIDALRDCLNVFIP